jgi:hypothetical protein
MYPHKNTRREKNNQNGFSLFGRNGQQIATKEVFAIPETPETKLQTQDSAGDNKGKYEKWQPKFWMGGTDASYYFTGKIAEVQVWNKAREPKEIRDSTYLRLTGKEVGLVGDWRLGADSRRKATHGKSWHFSVFGNNGIVYGDPFVSAVILDRTLRDNTTQVIQYANDDLVGSGSNAPPMKRALNLS